MDRVHEYEENGKENGDQRASCGYYEGKIVESQTSHDGQLGIANWIWSVQRSDSDWGTGAGVLRRSSNVELHVPFKLSFILVTVVVHQ